MERATEIVVQATVPHPFTISSAPTANHLRFTIKYQAIGPERCARPLEVGTEVLVRGPYGRFDSAIAPSGSQVVLA